MQNYKELLVPYAIILLIERVYLSGIWQGSYFNNRHQKVLICYNKVKNMHSTYMNHPEAWYDNVCDLQLRTEWDKIPSSTDHMHLYSHKMSHSCTPHSIMIQHTQLTTHRKCTLIYTSHSRGITSQNEQQRATLIR